MSSDPELIYPIVPRPSTAYERIAREVQFTPGYCVVCGKLTIFKRWVENYRDTGRCARCNASNRQRQLAFTLCVVLSHARQRPIRSLLDVVRLSDLLIYNTESSGAIHQSLSNSASYTSSEYLAPHFDPGQIVHGVRHEDLGKLSFPDNRFDVVLSADVLEHVPDPYGAHKEIWRVLKPAGRHVFTVPFHQTDYQDEVRARMVNGETQHEQPPIYHVDPLRPDGVLVYTIFSLEMLLKLKELGFRTHVYRLYHPVLGLLGSNALTFVAVRD